MYAPYVRDQSSARRHGATILDAEIVYSHWIDRMPRGWWLAAGFVAMCGIAGWLAALPLS